MIPPLNEMIRELGKVTLFYWEGLYQASDDKSIRGGDTPEGAVWNLVLARRGSPTKGVTSKVRDGVTGAAIQTRKYDASGQEIFDIPAAGQDSY